MQQVYWDEWFIMNPSIVDSNLRERAKGRTVWVGVEDEQVAGARDEVPKYRGEKFVLKYRK